MMIVALIVLTIYGVYWLMFLPYILMALTTPKGWMLWFDSSGPDGIAGPIFLLMALTTPKGWMLWFDSSGPDGIAGPIFLWFLVIMNPAIVIYLLNKVRNRADNKSSGVLHVDL